MDSSSKEENKRNCFDNDMFQKHHYKKTSDDLAGYSEVLDFGDTNTIGRMQELADNVVCDRKGNNDDVTNDLEYETDDYESDDSDLNNEESGNISKPTLLELAQLAKMSTGDSFQLSSDGNHSRSRRDNGSYLPPPPPPPPLPPQPLGGASKFGVASCCLPPTGLVHSSDHSGLPPTPPPPPPLPLHMRGCGLKKSPARQTSLPVGSCRFTCVDDLPGPEPSTSYDNMPVAGASRDNLDVDGDLAAAREHVRIMIENIRRYVPLCEIVRPDNMQLDELQSAIMEFRYLEQTLLDQDDYLDFEDFGFNLDMQRFGEKAVEPAFARGVEIKTECQICFDEVNLYKRICCDFPVCDPCMEQYIETSVNQGVVKIQCIGSSCNAFLYRDEILGRLTVPMKDKYYKYLVDANKDPKVKTCPRCSNIHTIVDSDLENQSKFGLLVTCPECLLDWCFECQAPWHKDVKCKEFRKGDKLVKSWAKEKHYGNANAQKCPKCKIFIERKGGCDHMTCSRCDTGFCYKCGGRYLDLKFFGNHLSRYSPLGCKYNFKPNRPFLRRFVRGSVFGAKCLGGLVLVSLGVAAVGVLVGASVVILPAFGAYKYRKHRKFKRRLKRQQELIKMRSRNAMLELHRERPLMLDPRHLREKETLQEFLVEIDELTARSNRPTGNDTVHIGIQTGQSQQVDVTVHNPYQPDALVANDDTQSSEIRMNISDERGHVTVTTAEISHNSNTGEGSEAEIVLHVKTSYPKHERDTKNSTDVSVVTANNEKRDLSKLDMGTKLDVKDSNLLPKSPLNSENQPKSAQVHRRAHSTGSVRKSVKKQEFGSISRRWKLKALSGRKTSEGDVPESAVPNNQDESGSLTLPEEKKLSVDPDENSEADNLEQSGCFLKLLGKKLNTLNQIEKEKQLSAKSDSNLGERLNCPDVVSCALQAELKGKENMKTEVHDTDVKAVEKDAYYGLISTETDTTAL